MESSIMYYQEVIIDIFHSLYLFYDYSCLVIISEKHTKTKFHKEKLKKTEKEKNSQRAA